jgi:hypothetical protein
MPYVDVVFQLIQLVWRSEFKIRGGFKTLAWTKILIFSEQFRVRRRGGFLRRTSGRTLANQPGDKSWTAAGAHCAVEA